VKYKAALFDLDGTLVDTLADLSTAMNFALKHLDQPTHTIDQCKAMIGSGLAMFAKRALDSNHQHLKDDLLVEMKQRYNLHCFEKTTIYPGISDALLALQNAGIRLAVVTNKDSDAALKIVEHFFGNDTFDHIAGAENGIAIKPQPQPTLDILTSMGLSPDQCLFIGDSDVDMQTAAAAQIRSVAVSWGFRSTAQLKDAGADIIIDSAAELLDLLT